MDIDSAVDLSALGLDYISERDGYIEIGAMATLSSLENSSLLKSVFDGILPETAKLIMGIQVRNTATAGGTVAGRYGFSDLLTSLLALDTRVVLHKSGEMSLEDYISWGNTRDILTGIMVKKEERKAAFANIRNTSTDFSILNAAVSRCGKDFRISVGARPLQAKLSREAMEYMDAHEINAENALRAGEIAAETLEFGSDIRGSGAYRKELCKALVKRCIMGVK
jgi:CO/xanthine dehydrogenase FAD-binding subunit